MVTGVLPDVTTCYQMLLSCCRHCTVLYCSRIEGKTIVDGTREKRDCLSSLLEQKHISLFYRNSHCKGLSSIRYSIEEKRQFLRKFLVPLFSKRGSTRQFCRQYCWLYSVVELHCKIFSISTEYFIGICDCDISLTESSCHY